METQTDTVEARHPAFNRMMTYWEKIIDLLGGTYSMQQAESKWLPIEPKEKPERYQQRLARSYLHNVFVDTVDRIVTKPFSRPVTVRNGDKLPARLQPLLTNTDRNGLDLTQFLYDCFIDLVTWGKCHILVDFPMVPTDLDGQPLPLTLDDELKGDIRPFFVRIAPNKLFSWTPAPSYAIGMSPDALIELRWYSTEAMLNGAFEVVEQESIRRIVMNEWQIWTRQASIQGGQSQAWTLAKQGPFTFPGPTIPIITVYADREGPMECKPPLDDLAWLNIKHWQNSSDQNNLLRFARAATLVTYGFKQQEIDRIVVGPNAIIDAADPTAKAEFLEHSGNAIKVGAEDLRHIEEQMEVLGAQPFLRRSGMTTATAKAIDESRIHNDVQAWVGVLETSVLEAFKLAAKWTGEELPSDFSIDIFSEFSLSLRAGEDARLIYDTRKIGELTHEDFIRELKRRGILDEVVSLSPVDDIPANLTVKSTNEDDDEPAGKPDNDNDDDSSNE